MTKGSGFFTGKRSVILITGMLCILILGGILLTNVIGDGNGRHDIGANTYSEYHPGDLFAHRSQYIGDAGNIGNLLSKLPLGEYKKGISLATEHKPYGLTVNYDISNAGTYTDLIDVTLHDNAVIIFALIKNVEQISFNIASDTAEANNQLKYQYTRTGVQQSYQQDPWEYSRDIKVFSDFLNQLAFKLLVFPEQYTPAMSSTPGIRIAAEYRNPVGKVRYAADNGVLFKWDSSTGQMSGGAKTVELPYGNSVYWSPVSKDGQINGAENTKVTVTIFDPQGNKVGEKLATIRCADSMYQVQPAPGIVIGVQRQDAEPGNLEQAVSAAIKDQGKGYLDGECITEGHIILDTEERDGTVKAYTVASVGWFGFENGVFTKISGSGAIPTVMTFSRNEQGIYSIREYKEPVDGAGYTDSVKKMFPAKLHAQVLANGKYNPDLIRQQEEQAAKYLTGIGRSAKVNAGHVAKQLVDINVEASNKLFSELTKYDSFLNSCPYWIGSREQIEDGVRYIYETSQSKTSDGHDLVVFKKTRADGTVVKEAKYKIMGSEPRLISNL
jgi:hypothetical protein